MEIRALLMTMEQLVEWELKYLCYSRKLATNRLSYGTASKNTTLILI
jgi:hypothetical protein